MAKAKKKKQQKDSVAEKSRGHDKSVTVNSPVNSHVNSGVSLSSSSSHVNICVAVSEAECNSCHNDSASVFSMPSVSAVLNPVPSPVLDHTGCEPTDSIIHPSTEISDQNLTSPEKDANNLLRSHDLSPTKLPLIAKELTSFNTLVTQISTSSKKVKRDLLQKPSSKSIPKCASHLARKLGVDRHSLFRKPRTRAFHKTQHNLNKTKAVQFLKRYDNSTPLPGKKDFLGNATIQKYTLNDTNANLYSKFIAENPTVKMSRATFARQRPKWIKPISWATRRQCLCARHQNATLKLKSIKQHGSPNVFLQRNTDEQIKDILLNLPNDVIRFSEWRNEEIKFEGKTLKKMRLQQHELPKSEFIMKFTAEFAELRQHVRRINSQYIQLATLRENLCPLTEATCQMDYAENYSCIYQDEPSSVFYDRNQITIHPMIIHYCTPDATVQHKSFVGITASTAHTAPTCLAFLQQLIPKVKDLLPNLNYIHYISDSPSSQYRNKSIVKLVAQHESIFNGIKASWEYLESGHGKGPCDGVGGSIKKSAEIAVKSGKIISTAQEFYEWGISLNSNIDFVFVSPNEIKQAEKKLHNAGYVKGISNIHSLRLHDNKVYMRETSCFKPCCRYSISCPDWEETSIRVETVSQINPGTDINIEGQVSEVVTESLSNMETSHSDESRQSPYKVGMMVKAKYQGRFYVGKVLDLDPENDEILITFMKKGRGQVYVWPSDAEPEDLLWMKLNKVVTEVFLDESGKLKPC